MRFGSVGLAGLLAGLPALQRPGVRSDKPALVGLLQKLWSTHNTPRLALFVLQSSLVCRLWPRLRRSPQSTGILFSVQVGVFFAVWWVM
mmetsp:Transcript_4123/g.10022  ORF Transcript_4123/g.10022 Transcript_4123/m.10022 type:complete len:89 (-) Transcript_4123:23-289(-)